MSLTRWQRRIYKVLWLWKHDGRYPLFEWYGRLGRSIVQPVKTKAGFFMKINPADTVVSSHIWRMKSWGEDETRLIRSHVKEGQAVIDVGANIGYFSLLCSQVVGKTGTVIAFEPDRINFSLLQQNKELNKFSHLTVNQLAVGATSGTVQLYLEPENKGDHRVFPAAGHVQGERVQMVSLDEYLQHQHLDPDFIKIDIQGYEIQASRGMKHLLRLPHIKLLIEFWPKGLREGGEQPEEFFTLLRQSGFQVFHLPNLKTPLQRNQFLERQKTLGEIDTTLFASKQVKHRY